MHYQHSTEQGKVEQGIINAKTKILKMNYIWLIEIMTKL